MKSVTHLKIDPKLCGIPLSINEGKCQIELKTLPEMAVDDKGLIHGGFVFGLADYAAMVAVNHPNVVLGASTTRFLKPVTVGENIVASAEVEKIEGRKYQVNVIVQNKQDTIFSGKFTAYILDQHVLENG